MFEVVIEAYRWFFLRLADFVGLGWGVVVLSFICSALMMPLMKLVAGIVGREADYQAVILPQIADIKSRYSSDAERHVHIQRLYRRYGYSPLSAVKKILPLFVQIPFLLLTYFMLKDTAELQGVSFLFLRDLGQPDGLVPALGINLLPLVMTAINLLTVAATPGFTRKDNVQAVSISLLFLVLLYAAPSALLLYWTLNNVITMFRTLFAKHGEGARLFLARVALMRNLPLALRRMATQRMLAYVSLSLLALTQYFWVTARLMSSIDGGITCSTMFRGMAFVLAVASVVQFFHLKDEQCVRKFVLYGSVFACVGFAAFLAGMFFLSGSIISRMTCSSFLECCDLYLVVVCLTIIWMLPYLSMRGACVFRNIGDYYKPIAENWWILGFPAVLAVHYAYASKMFELPITSVVVLCVCMVLPCVVAGLGSIALFRRWIEGAVLLRLSVGIIVGIYLVPMISTETGALAYNRNLLVRLAMIAAMAMAFARLRNRGFGLVFQGLLLASIVVNAVIDHGDDIAQPVAEDTTWRERLNSVVGDAHCVKSNNVYLLVYDSYGHRSILDGLGLQDDTIYEKLRARGYTLYDAYSTGAHTLTSMPAMFTFDGVAGSSDRATVGGDNVFCDLLRESGYYTSYVLVGYLLEQKAWRTPGHYYYPRKDQLPKSWWILLSCILRGTLSQSPQVFESSSMDDWIAEKYNVLEKCADSHTFVYAHMEYPQHAPWRPRYRKTDKEEQRMYKERLKVANEYMIKDVELLERDPDAIVILMSDHGGSLIVPKRAGEWGIENLIDHFGVFLAIRWPKDYKPMLKLNCLQNVLVEVMIYLTGDKSLSRLQVSGSTVSLDYPFWTPAGAINNGIIQFGEGKGKDLFEAAWQVFGRGKHEISNHRPQ